MEEIKIMEEIKMMIQILSEMSTDSYLQCKYVLMAVSRERPRVEDFTKKLFNLTDRRRPLQIGIKENRV